MYKILLCCAAGMSTSLLVTKMKKYAKIADIEVDVWAVPVAELKDNLPVDCILLGPQIRYAEKSVKETVGDTPVVNIDMRSYGRMDGEKVLNMAVDAIEKK